MSIDAHTATRRQAVDAAWHHLRVHRNASHQLTTPGLIDAEMRRTTAYLKALADLRLADDDQPIAGQLAIE